MKKKLLSICFLSISTSSNFANATPSVGTTHMGPSGMGVHFLALPKGTCDLLVSFTTPAKLSYSASSNSSSMIPHIETVSKQGETVTAHRCNVTNGYVGSQPHPFRYLLQNHFRCHASVNIDDSAPFMSFQAARVRSNVFGTAPDLENPATYEIKEDAVTRGHGLSNLNISYSCE